MSRGARGSRAASCRPGSRAPPPAPAARSRRSAPEGVEVVGGPCRPPRPWPSPCECGQHRVAQRRGIGALGEPHEVAAGVGAGLDASQRSEGDLRDLAAVLGLAVPADDAQVEPAAADVERQPVADVGDRGVAAGRTRRSPRRAAAIIRPSRTTKPAAARSPPSTRTWKVSAADGAAPVGRREPRGDPGIGRARSRSPGASASPRIDGQVVRVADQGRVVGGDRGTVRSRPSVATMATTVTASVSDGQPRPQRPGPGVLQARPPPACPAGAGARHGPGATARVETGAAPRRWPGWRARARSATRGGSWRAS